MHSNLTSWPMHHQPLGTCPYCIPLVGNYPRHIPCLDYQVLALYSYDACCGFLHHMFLYKRSKPTNSPSHHQQHMRLYQCMFVFPCTDQGISHCHIPHSILFSSGSPSHMSHYNHSMPTKLTIGHQQGMTSLSMFFPHIGLRYMQLLHVWV